MFYYAGHLESNKLAVHMEKLPWVLWRKFRRHQCFQRGLISNTMERPSHEKVILEISEGWAVSISCHSRSMKQSMPSVLENEPGVSAALCTGDCRLTGVEILNHCSRLVLLCVIYIIGEGRAVVLWNRMMPSTLGLITPPGS